MVRWVLHGGPIGLFLVPECDPRLMYQGPWYVYGMMQIKETLLLIGKSSLCGGSGVSLLLSE